MRVFWSPLGCSWSTRRIVSLLACVLASPAAVARACDTLSFVGASSQYVHMQYKPVALKQDRWRPVWTRLSSRGCCP